jgi:hypothetical protein
MILRLMSDGFYLSAAAFPAVSLGEGGVRFAQTLHTTRSQLSALMDAIEHHLPQVASPSADIVVDLRDDAPVLGEEAPL